jgi:LuxR family transcriptional regulator, maltose regulon positive regulatory protein
MATSRLQLLPPIRHQRVLHDGRFLQVLSQQRGTLALHDGAARRVGRHDAAPSAAPLIATKLLVPPPSASLLARERLITQIHGLQRALTLVIAPAGYGKTTLLSAWARQSATPIAWVSLDADDSAPHRFWAYVIAALDAAQPGVGVRAQALLDTTTVTLERVLTTLINTLSTAQPMTLVLDDYHVIDVAGIHQSLAFLLNHLPDTLHIVLASRAEPSLPLAHWRATDALTELGVAELRFTDEEAATLISEITQQRLTDDVVTMLMEHTEGWAAGLRLAARGARTSADVTRFLQDFNGSHRDIQDYLDQEVFGHIPADMQAFVLQSGVLDRLCAPLCDAVMGLTPDERPMTKDEGPTKVSESIRNADHALSSFVHRPPSDSYSQIILDQLERAGLFLIPLDAERGWYRYHTLIAEAIRHRLNQDAPEQAALLRQRAAAWYAEQPDKGPASAALDPLLEAHQEQRAPADLVFSKRELEVLRLLADGCANQDIALALIIGVNTVKMHLQHLYDKLDVHNRVQAILRARALGLL